MNDDILLDILDELREMNRKLDRLESDISFVETAVLSSS